MQLVLDNAALKVQSNPDGSRAIICQMMTPVLDPTGTQVIGMNPNGIVVILPLNPDAAKEIGNALLSTIAIANGPLPPNMLRQRGR